MKITNVRLFWDILNECLRKVSGKTNYKFNPVGWCTDMAGANLAGLSEVFGETVTDRIKTCEFHFKDPRNKNARKLDPDSAVEFKTRCYNLLLSATEGAYKCSIVVPAIMQKLPENFRLTITRGEEFLTWLMERMLQAFLKELELREDHFYAMTSSKPSYSNRLDGKDNRARGTTANAPFTKQENGNRAFCLGKHAHENRQRVQDPRECKKIVYIFARCLKCMKKGHRARDCKIDVLCNKCGQAGHHVSLCDVRNAPQVPPVAEFQFSPKWARQNSDCY